METHGVCELLFSGSTEWVFWLYLGGYTIIENEVCYLTNDTRIVCVLKTVVVKSKWSYNFESQHSFTVEHHDEEGFPR